MKISEAVGVGGRVKGKDVATIQVLLNRYIDAGKLPGARHLSIDGDWGPDSKTAFAMFELVFMGWAIGRVDPGSERLKKLNEMSYAGIESLLKKFTDETDEWTEAYDASKVEAIHWIPEAAKAWARLAPTDDIEAALFKSKDPDYAGVIVWKSREPWRFVTTTDRWDRLQIYALKPESRLFYEARGATAKEALMLSETFKAWNSAVYFYVVERHFNLSQAFTRVRIDSTKELLLVFDLISMLPAGPLGAIKFYTPRTAGVSRIEHVAKTLETNYGKIKTAMSRWDAIHRKYSEPDKKK